MVLSMVLLLLALFASICHKTASQESRLSFNIHVTPKKVGKVPSKEVTAKAHLMEDLLLFLDLELDPSNFTEIAEELSSIPHRITVDVSSEVKGTRSSNTFDVNAWLDEYIPNTECMDYIPTYLFAFDREDILDEFGSEYFLLHPSPDSKRTREIYQEEKEVPMKPKMLLHIPKTGSSFQSTAINLGYVDFGHEPCPVGTDCKIITMLREPSDRLISWFYYSGDAEHCGLNKLKSSTETEYKAALQKCFNDFLKDNYYRKHEKNKKEIRTIFWGCETRMLVGSLCDSGEELIPTQYGSDLNLFTNKAIEKMRDEKIFSFIGNTDFFEASITLSHQMLGRNLYLTQEFDMFNSRVDNEEGRSQTGNPKLDQIQYEADFLCENNVLCNNDPDDIIFRETKRLMMFNLLKHHNNPLRLLTTNSLPRHPYALPKKYSDAKCKVPQSVTDKFRNRNKFVF